VNLALALANITTNYQRPDKESIVAMKKKQRGTAADTANKAQAKKIIEREGHSLDRDWSRLSWKQKASNIVRLKLLKDDGYDITPLTNKEKNHDAEIYESSTCRPDTKASLPHISNTTYHLNSTTLTPHLLQQDLYSRKRKHTHDHDSQTSHPSPPRKKRRLHSPNHTTFTSPTSALQTLKRHLRRSLFASSRTCCSRFQLTTSQGANSQVPILVSTKRSAPLVSRIIFTPQAPGRRPSGADAYIGSTAFELLGREVEWIGKREEEGDGGCWVCDSELEDEESVGCGIRLLVKSGEGDAVLEGETRALVALLGHLRGGELMHLGRWKVCDVGVDAEGMRCV
ncbi:hypothetical protein COCMIDRAFT_48755, partial [Bipolaris oryzae ATCC 44560]